MSLPSSLVNEFESKLASSKIGVATLQQLMYACLEGKVMVVPVDSVRNEHAWRRTLTNVKAAFGFKLDVHGDIARSVNSESCQDSDFASSEDVVVLSHRNQESLSLNLNSCSSWEDPGLWTPKQPLSTTLEKKTEGALTAERAHEIFLREKKGVDVDPERSWRALTEEAKKKYYQMAEKEKTMLEHLKRQHNIPHKIPNLSSNEASSEQTPPPPRADTTKKEPCISSMKHPSKPTNKLLPKNSSAKNFQKSQVPKTEKKKSVLPLTSHDNRPPRGASTPTMGKKDKKESRSSESERGIPKNPRLLSGSGSEDPEVETPGPGLRKGVQISNVGSNKKQPQRLLSGSASSEEN